MKIKILLMEMEKIDEKTNVEIITEISKKHLAL